MNTSAEHRPIAMRRRSDLIVRESVYQGERSWIVKDPVGMKYYRLLAPEYLALEMLDSPTSYFQIKQALDQAFPQNEFRLEDVHSLVNSFHQNGLTVTQASGQAQPLQSRLNKERKQKAVSLLMSVMSLKFPGVDPERFLSWLYPYVRWFFSPMVTALLLLLCGSALLLVLQNLDEFYRRLPEFYEFFNVKNAMFLAVILMVTKSVHELGHGLMCKHFGGECHEIGFMLLVLTPAMYCNTSDSWILPNKWQRIAIGAAGMYVEMVMAAVATFVWWYTHPSAIHYLALNVMFLSSVSTLLFNANPLLRYDGYYMLADFLEIPNLGQKSKTALISKLRVSCLGMKPIESRLQPTQHQTAFAIYSVASFVYRWFVMLMIFWFLTKVFEPYGLAVLGHLAIAISLIGLIVVPCYKLVKFFLYPGRIREVKRPQLIVSGLALASLIAGLFYVPLPYSVPASFVVQPTAAQRVFVDQPGLLKSVYVHAGDRVATGDVIVVLGDVDLSLSLENLKGKLASHEANLTAFQLSQTSLADGSRMISETQLQIADLKKRIRLVQEQLDALTLVATRSGTIIEAPNVPSPIDSSDRRRLVRWSGTPLDQQNGAAFLERGTLYCLIGEPQEMSATLVIEESVAKLVVADQAVEMMFAEYPGKRVSGVVESVSRKPLVNLPRELDLQNGGSVPTERTADGLAVPMTVSYEATVRLDESTELEMLTGFRGRAKIHVGSLPLGPRLVRYLHSVINFR